MPFDRSASRLLRCLSFAITALVGILAAGVTLAAAPPVEALALFKDRALLRDATGEHLLEEGETSPHGVTLLEADAHGARVRFGGEIYQLALSRHVSGRFQAAERQRVSISPDAHGQYRIRGAINDHFVNFLVDTGASVVAMSRRHAAALGIDPSRGREGSVQTAQGVTRSHFVELAEVTVGGITAYNVQAAVIDGNYPLEILLGMSFLRQVGMEENAGVLTLVQKQ